MRSHNEFKNLLKTCCTIFLKCLRLTYIITIFLTNKLNYAHCHSDFFGSNQNLVRAAVTSFGFATPRYSRYLMEEFFLIIIQNPH